VVAIVIVVIVKIGLVTLAVVVDGLLVELLHKGLLVVEVESKKKRDKNHQFMKRTLYDKNQFKID